MKYWLLVLLVLFSSLALSQEDEIDQEVQKTVKSLSEPIVLEQNFLTSLMGVNTKQMVMDFIKQNPFSNMTEGELRSLLESAMADQKIGSVLKENPKFMAFMVRWLKDKKAMPSALGILNQTEKLKTFSFIVLGVLILSFILNLVNTGSLLKRILFKLLLFFGVSFVNFAVFSYMFYSELRPTFNIIKQII